MRVWSESPLGMAGRSMDRRRRPRRDRRPVERRAAGSGRVIALAAACALALPPAAQADTTTYAVSQTVPVTMATTNTCIAPPEPVVLSGTYHFTSRYSITYDTTGTTFHSVESKKWSLSGITPTGARYQGEQQQVAEENGTFEFALDGLAPYERTDKATMLLIRQGEITRFDDFYVRAIAHITYNANGVITVSGATLDIVCR
jgi:hypothetical protein